MEMTAIPKKQEDLLERINPEGSVSIMALTETGEELYVLDGLVAQTWQLIDEERSWQTIHSELVARFHPPQERFDKDFLQLIQDFHEQGLLQ
jgi:hypothetical protein